MRTSVSGTLVVTLLLCTCLEAARTRYPHLKRPERLKRAKRLVPTNELDDFTFFSTVGKNSDVLVMFYRDNVKKKKVKN